MQVDNALDLTLGEVCQGEIVAHEEGETGVVIFKVQRLPHAGGHLIHKAEDAFVFAAHLTVHQIGFKLQPQVVVFVLIHNNGTDLSFLIAQQDLQVFIGHIEPIVQHVGDCVAVDTDEGIPLVYPCASGGTSRLHAGDSYCHLFGSFPHIKNGQEGK